MGMLFAKCIQDGRLVDIPLSRPLLKLMCMGDVADNVTLSCSVESSREPSSEPLQVTKSPVTPEDDLTPTEPLNLAEFSSTLKYGSSGGTSSVGSSSYAPYWYSGLLTQDDFETVAPHRARFLQQLREMSTQPKDSVSQTTSAGEESQSNTAESTEDAVADLCLTFVFNPSSRVHGYDVVELKPGGADIAVTSDNVDEYIDAVTDFCIGSGIRRQMDALRSGFNRVFPMNKLVMFNPDELRTMLCGDQSPSWTRDDVINYTEPKLGYSKDSPGFMRLVDVLVGLGADERKSFLQFTTGCSSLPPGGLANLQPRLTIVRKVDGNDGSYPSVNTCVHYLKLPEYSSVEILRERLMVAMNEKGFHLN